MTEPLARLNPTFLEVAFGLPEVIIREALERTEVSDEPTTDTPADPPEPAE